MDTGPAGLKQIQELIFRILEISTPLAFIALTVMLFVAGIKYLTSGGEAKQLQSAALTATWAILGILFLALAWLIIKLIEAFTGVHITDFCLGFNGSVTNCSIKIP